MGNCSSAEQEETIPGVGSKANMQSKLIDQDIEISKQQEDNKVKLLLLGAGESGKSTVFKQMRILHGSPPTEDDLKMYGVVIRHNIIVAVRKLCLLLRTLGLQEELEKESAGPEGDEETEDQEQPTSGGKMTPKEAYDEIMSYVVNMNSPAPAKANPQDMADGDIDGEGEADWCGQNAKAGLAANNDAKLFLRHIDAIETLWKSNTMKEVWGKRAQANVIDGHKDYLSDLARISSKSFKPSQQDILLARMRTQQVIMERYTIDGIDFEMYDVGGQRSERRKWIDCFDSVDAVIFVAALSEYDQALAESKRTNRMIEALELFRGVCNNRAFALTSIMLFLNKKDIFAEKILYSDICDQKPFADYAGPPHDFDHGVLYFIQKFKDCQLDNEFNDSFIHVTCATDTNNMEFVLDSTRMIIMTDNLRKSGILGND
eukprot:CAMPEP_0172480206 /NCGR_PEP_ID=MMETSP1066-20121228/5245_1 /TAXON_ID=671091 /ORGANISM="Coscinodiscus wailesii, Strain CCMP2513" /LENGTH=430 /DNA_ID=CAMNT_0013241333 /DNA_START=392 /DNA_END=1684 /DNA_ORIENTATION=+